MMLYSAGSGKVPHEKHLAGTCDLCLLVPTLPTLNPCCSTIHSFTVTSTVTDILLVTSAQGLFAHLYMPLDTYAIKLTL